MSANDLQSASVGGASSAAVLGLHAQPAASPVADTEPSVSLLSISVPKGNTSTIKVYVSLSGSTVNFSATSGGTGYSGGVVFVFADSSTLSTSWVLGTGINSLSSTMVNFGTASNGAQSLSLTPNSAGAWTANFSVSTTSGRIDPQMIVTPIGGS